MSGVRANVAASAVLALTGCAAGPGGQAAYAPPADCVLLASVERRDCRVLQVLSCGGETRTVAFRDGEEGRTSRHLHGLFETEGATPDGAARESFRYDDPAALAAFRPADPASRVVARGTQSLMRRDGTEERAFAAEWRGADATVAVSGRSLLRLPVAGEGSAGGQAIRSDGAVFYDPGFGVAVGHDLNAPGGRIDATPVAIALPGQPGFGAVATTAACAAD